MELNVEDLATVWEEVFDVQARCYDLGLKLKVPVGKLDGIRKQYPDLSDQLREILKEWLKTSTQRTWQTLADALKSRIVNEPTLASNIEDKYCKGTPGQASGRTRNTYERIHNIQEQVRASQENQRQLQQQLEDQRRAFEAMQIQREQLMERPSAQPQLNPDPPQRETTLRKLIWRDGPKAPQAMTRGSIATDGTMVYCNDWKSTRVHQYHSDTQQWSTLPDLPHLWSTLVMVDSKLTSVGGYRRFALLHRATDSLLSLVGEGRDRKWLSHFLPMKTKRYATAAIYHDRSLIVAGGMDNNSKILDTVEVLNVDNEKWVSASSLPPPFCRATASICGERLYFLGGYNKTEWIRSVHTCSISELLNSCKTLSQATIWQRVADAPYKGSSCATLCGQLVVVGGDDEKDKDTGDVGTYDESTDSWLRMEPMKSPRWCALVASLHDNTLVVVGGFHGKRLNTVEIAKVS